jgi:bile acid:Na+ symporter, BASS family
MLVFLANLCLKVTKPMNEKAARWLKWFSNQMFLWVVIVALAGYFFPQILVPLNPYKDWLFAFTMLGIGMVLSPKDIQSLWKKPVPVLLGSAAQFVIMPLLAFIVAKMLNLPAELAAGLILAGAVPDAMAAGVVSYLAEADVAFSVSLTTLTTIVSPVVTPALTKCFAGQYVQVDFLPMFLSIIEIVIVPLAVGFLVKRRFTSAIEKFEPVFPAFSTVFIAFICGLVVALNQEKLTQLTYKIFLAVVLLNAGGLILGYAAGKLFRFNVKYCRTLAIGVAMQNAGLGVVLALNHLPKEAAIPNALFATWCIITASLLARFWTRRKKQPQLV